MPSAAVPARPDVAEARTRTAASRSWLRGLLTVAVLAALAVIAVRHRDLLAAGRVVLGTADRNWLILAGLATAGLWGAGTAMQLGAMPTRPRLSRLFAVQVAASFVNHVSPMGSGGIVVNARFMRRLGMSRAAAAGAIGVNSAAAILAHLVLLVGVVVLYPSTITGLTGATELSDLPPYLWRTVVENHQRLLWVLGAALLLPPLVLALGLLLPGGRARARQQLQRLAQARTYLRRELATVVRVCKDPSRGLQLWGGAVSTPLLNALVVVAVLRSLSSTLPTATIVVTYLAASALSALLPSPGAVGALDVTMYAGLVAAGSPPSTAMGATLGYRLITVWLPLVPGAAVLMVLVRRRII